MKIFATHKISSLRITNWLFLTAALALIVMAGISACAKIDGPQLGDNGWNDLDGDRPIRFSANIATPATKTDQPISPNTPNTTFGVFAFYQTGTAQSTAHWNTSRTPNFMFNEDIHYNGSIYYYTPIKYWPNNTYNTITFWAYSPYSPTSDDVVFLNSSNHNNPYTSSTPNLPDIQYTVNAGKTDLLVSSPVQDEAKGNLDKTVTFNFHHTLSKINFTVKTQNAPGDITVYKVQLTSIQFQYIKKTAIHNNTSHWSSTSNEGNITVFSGTQDVTTSVVDVSNANVMLIPQTHVPMSRIHVEYRISNDNGETYTAYSADKFINGTTWAESTEYSYNISITPGYPILFTVNWNSWGNIENYHITD